jgi:hypothetical protein
MVESESSRARLIGQGIRSIANDWTAGRNERALSTARNLRRRFAKNGDVAGVLGAALIRVSPPRYKEADRELEIARSLGCVRPELIANFIRSKTALKDWSGLYQITRSLSSHDGQRDQVLESFLSAIRELIAAAKERRDHQRAAELAIEAVEKTTSKLSRQTVEHLLATSLRTQQVNMAREYLSALSRQHNRPGDGVKIFEGIVRLAETEVILPDAIKLGLTGLEDWWAEIEKRPVRDYANCSDLKRQLSRMERIERQLSSYATIDEKLLPFMIEVRRDLEHRGGEFSKQLRPNTAA